MPALTDAQAQFVGKLAAGLESLTQAVDNLRKDVRDQGQHHNVLVGKLNHIEASVEGLSDNLTQLTKLVRDGNGQPSLQHRLTTLEVQHLNLVRDVLEMATQLNTVQTAKYLGKAQFWALLISMMISALLALGAILSQMAGGGGHGGH